MVYTQLVDWTEFYDALDRVLAEMESERFEAIVAIAQGGILPAALLQQEWGVPMGVVHINYRDNENKPRFADARLLDEGPPPFAGRKVLLVDDVSRTGRTLAKARAYLANSTVKTFLVNGEADFHLYKTDECLRMPWKRD